jgi:hypothetical protein
VPSRPSTTLGVRFLTVTIHAYVTDNHLNEKICAAFAKGAKCEVVPVDRYLGGDVFVHGVLRGAWEIVQAAQEAGRSWFFGDNAYFRSRHVGGLDGGYFRITKNARQHDGSGVWPPERWRALKMMGVTIEPWRTSGRHVLICTQSGLYAKYAGFDQDAWLKDAIATLRQHTDREIRVREKPIKGRGVPLAQDLKGCWAVVTHTSNSAVEALLAGVPVFCVAPCAAYRMGTPDLSRIEAPVRPDDREAWAQALACNQWRLDEIGAGVCWRDLTQDARR